MNSAAGVVLAAAMSPSASRFVFAAGLAAGFIGISAVALPLGVKWKRRVYWGGWTVAIFLLALCVLERGLATVALAALAGVAAAALYAFYFTPFIKIGGRVRTFWISDARQDPDEPPPPPDSYLGRVTASSMWWNLAVLGLVTGGFALSTGWLAPVGIMGGALLAAPLALIGHLDRKDRFPVSRGQYFPFTIVALSSIPTFLWPIVVYFAAYYMTTPTDRGDATHDPFIGT